MRKLRSRKSVVTGLSKFMLLLEQLSTTKLDGSVILGNLSTFACPISSLWLKRMFSKNSSSKGFHYSKRRHSSYLVLYVINEGLPRWLNGKESACQFRRPSFDHWVRKLPWSRKWQPTPLFLPGKFHGQRKLRRRQWHPTPILLPGKSHGRRSLVGYSPWGR